MVAMCACSSRCTTSSAAVGARASRRLLGWIAGPWLAFVGLSVGDAARDPRRRSRRRDGWRRKALRGRPAGRLSRREFLARVTGGAAVAVAELAWRVGMIEGARRARDRRRRGDAREAAARARRLLDRAAVRPAHRHDDRSRRSSSASSIARTRSTPDLIALTGDLVDGPVADLRDDVAPLAEPARAARRVRGHRQPRVLRRRRRVDRGDHAARRALPAQRARRDRRGDATLRPRRRRRLQRRRLARPRRGPAARDSAAAIRAARSCCSRTSRARSTTPRSTASISSSRATRTAARSGRGTTS